MKRRKNTISVSGYDATKLSIESEDMDAAIATFLRHCRVKNLTELTVEYYTDVLSILKRMLKKHEITQPIDITTDILNTIILEKRDEGVVDATINKYLRGWRAFFNYMYNEGYITTNPFASIGLIKSERRIIETFSKPQLEKLLAASNKKTFTGYRSYVLMLLLLETGVRISEAEGTLITNINWKERLIKVYGKGRKERYVPFQNTLDKHLREYIAIRGPLDHDFLYIDNSPMKKRTMQEEIQRYGLEAGIKGVRCSAHTFRHTFAKMYIMAGGDIFSLQRILGHSSLDMVRVYVNLFGTDIAKQHAKYSPLERLQSGID